ncbi:MAG: hypothetical protein ACLFVI_05410 [Archaeoglobaceae archaeon]
MATREEIHRESKQGIKTSVPKIIVNLVVAGLIWLFAVLVFQPLANTLGDPFLFGLIGMTALISGIVLIALVLIFLRIIKEVGDLTYGIAGLTALSFSRGETSESKLERYRSGFRWLGYVVVAVVAYLFFLPIIAGLHPTLAGIILVVLLIWAILMLLRVGGVFSEDIEKKAGEISQRVEELKEPREET